jgi:hypothetical protein
MPMARFGWHDLSQGTLNPLQMIGLFNRSHRSDLEKLVFLCQSIRRA